MKDGIYFLTDGNGNKTHAVMPIAIYEELLLLRSMTKKRKGAAADEIYTLRKGKITAHGYPDGSRSAPSFVLIKDSMAALETVSSLPEHVKKIRESLLDDGGLTLCPEHNCFTLTRDLKVQSPSLAAAIVTGNVRNGLDVWKNSEGFSLKQSGFGIKPHKTGKNKSDGK